MSAADVVDNILRLEPSRAVDAMHEMIRARAEELVLSRANSLVEESVKAQVHLYQDGEHIGSHIINSTNKNDHLGNVKKALDHFDVEDRGTNHPTASHYAGTEDGHHVFKWTDESPNEAGYKMKAKVGYAPHFNGDAK